MIYLGNVLQCLPNLSGLDEAVLKRTAPVSEWEMYEVHRHHIIHLVHPIWDYTAMMESDCLSSLILGMFPALNMIGLFIPRGPETGFVGWVCFVTDLPLMSKCLPPSLPAGAARLG